jgi:hypothetical protein
MHEEYSAVSSRRNMFPIIFRHFPEFIASSQEGTPDNETRFSEINFEDEVTKHYVLSECAPVIMLMECVELMH